MKIYIVYSIPDYIGIDIDSVYLDEEKAKKRATECKQENIKYYGRDIEHYDYFEIEITK